MRKTIVNTRLFSGLLFILFLYSVLFFIGQRKDIFSHSYLNLAITVDFLFVIPIVYFFTIRKTEIPKITVVPVMVLGMLLCGLALPASEQWYLNGFQNWVFPFVELGVISFVTWKVRKLVKSYKAKQATNIDFFDTLKEACAELFPKKMVMPLATEIAVFYFGFFQWRKKKLDSNEFSYHQDSATQTLLFSVIGLVAVEMITVHLLLSEWNPTISWVFTVLSIYSAVQLFGFARAVRQRPIVLKNDALVLRYSFLKQVEIPWNEIATIELFSKDLEEKSTIAKLSLLQALEGHNVRIQLKSEHTLTGLYGTTKQFEEIVLHVDNKQKFVDAVRAQMSV